MRPMLKALGLAGLIALISGGASAQGFGIQIGPRDDRVIERRVIRERPAYEERRVIRERPAYEERRVIRREPTRTVCRTVVQERVRPNGVVVRRPTEVCRQVAGGRREYID